MRIAFVYPYLSRISGSRSPLSIASALSMDNEVDIFAYSVRKDLMDKINKITSNAHLNYHKKIDAPRFGIFFALRYQVFRGIDRRIFHSILERHRINPYDLIIVGSNEGRNIGQYFRTEKLAHRPVTATILMELHDHGFHLFYERSLKSIRYIAWIFYPFVNLVERWRFSNFDLIFSNSSWTATIFRYLYGLDISASLPTLAQEYLPDDENSEGDSYIAVPTVSVNEEHKKMIERLSDEGIKLICFGPRKVRAREYRGFVEDDERLKIMKNAHATLFLFDYEALGLIPLESLSLGTPVITIPKEGPYEELKDCKDVYFARSYDTIKSVITQLIKTYKDEETVTRCKQYASRFSPESSMAKIIESYNAKIGERCS